MIKPLVSIILPNYNHKPFLKTRLDSIFNQTYQYFEVILLDDASIDGSQAILETYKIHPKVSQVHFNTQNSGSPFKQWQKGIELAKGDYIWIAESDDYCELSFLEQLLKRTNDRTGICYAQTIDVNENGNSLLNRIEYTKEFTPNIWQNNFEISGVDFIENYLLKKNVIPNASGVIFKRSLINDSFFSKELLNMKMCGDWFFWLKICEHAKVSFLSESLNYFRNHKAVSRKHNTLDKKKLRLLEEGKIRYYIYIQLKLNHKGQNRKLIKKWFSLHNIGALLTTDFYKLRLPHTNNFSLLLKFVSFNFKKKVSV